MENNRGKFIDAIKKMKEKEKDARYEEFLIIAMFHKSFKLVLGIVSIKNYRPLCNEL